MSQKGDKSPYCQDAPAGRILAKLGMGADPDDVVTCARFDVKSIEGFWFWRGQCLLRAIRLMQRCSRYRAACDSSAPSSRVCHGRVARIVSKLLNTILFRYGTYVFAL